VAPAWTFEVAPPRVLAGGSGGSLLFRAREAVAKAGVDDVSAVGEAVDDGLGEAGVGEHFGPTRRTAGWW
jgi:hypothetical protein